MAALSVKISLTDSEWMSIIDQERDGLSICCANISALRDQIIAIARSGGELYSWLFGDVARTFYWTLDHGWSDAVKSIHDQLMTNEDFASYWNAIKTHEDAKQTFE